LATGETDIAISEVPCVYTSKAYMITATYLSPLPNGCAEVAHT
jgi:hypothetical protein